MSKNTGGFVDVTMETIWKNTGDFVDVTMETIWKNTGGFVDGSRIFRWIIKNSLSK